MPSALEDEGRWVAVLQNPVTPTQPQGDWRAYQHLAGHKMWREAMRPAVLALTEFLETKCGCYLECPIPGCNMQGSYADHVTSTSGWHFKHLYQKTGLLKDGVPVTHTRENAWEQRNILGGAIRFNHLDWEVLMWKGQPPPAPRFDAASQSSPTLFGRSDTSPFMEEPQFTTMPAAVVLGDDCISHHIKDMPLEGTWYTVMPRASEPTSAMGDWRTLPHVSAGKDLWRDKMKMHALRLATLLEQHGLNVYSCLSCSLCERARGWDEHIPGREHYKKINDMLGDQPVVSVRERFWQQWELRHSGVQGSICFNHLDGEIQMLRGGADPSPPLAIADVPTHAPTGVAGTKLHLPNFSDLQPGRWAQVTEPASVPTVTGGDFNSYPHMASKSMWQDMMKNSIVKLNAFLEQCNVWPTECICGRNVNGFQDHLLGVTHYKAFRDTMPEGMPIATFREQCWAQWSLPGGHLRFNHCDGVTEMCNIAGISHVPSPPLAVSVPVPSKGGTCAPPPPPIPLPTRGIAPPPSAVAGQADVGSLSPNYACLARLLWANLASVAASNLEAALKAARVHDSDRFCRLCHSSLECDFVCAHLLSDAHLKNLAITVQAVCEDKKDTWDVGGPEGQRVQKFQGASGVAWFNHITGEAGTEEPCAEPQPEVEREPNASNSAQRSGDPVWAWRRQFRGGDRGCAWWENTTNGESFWEERSGSWEKYDFADRGLYWWNRETNHYFEAHGNFGRYMGLWK